MKRAKRLTRKEKKKAAELLKDQPKPVSKPRKIKPMLTLTFYLQRQAKNKAEKLHHRQEKRDAKAGKPHVH